MTINRKYNFTSGQVIKSSEVNEEFDQLVNTFNTNVLDADYTTNNVVSDGDVVSAISAIDSYLGNNPPGGVLLYNSSRGVILKQKTYGGRTVQLDGTSQIIVFAQDPDYIFCENDTIELTLSSTGGFYDIYIEEDTLLTPVISGTKRIKITAKFADADPYSTSVDTGQFLVGCAYIYNSKILGIHSLETPNVPTYHEGNWGESDPFNFLISSTTVQYSTKKCYIPVFVKSSILYNLKTQYTTSGVDTAAWNFYFYVRRNGSTTDHYTKERVPPLSPTSNSGRTGRDTMDRTYNVSPGVYTYEFGGKIGTDDSPLCNVTIEWLYAHFFVYPNTVTFNTH